VLYIALFIAVAAAPREPGSADRPVRRRRLEAGVRNCSRKTRTGFLQRLLAASLVCSAFLSGCSGATGGVPDAVSTALDDSSSAVATARLALRLDATGKFTKAATSTTLDDVLKEIEASRTTVLRLSPAVQDDRDVRRDALTVLDGCIAGLTTARDAVASDDGAPPVPAGETLLASAADRLSDLKMRLATK
jgi:hypothetical protein